MVDHYGGCKRYWGEYDRCVVTVSCVGDYAKAVEMYQQIEAMDTPYSWCALGLGHVLSNNGQKGLQGVFFIIRHRANNLAWVDSIHSSNSTV